MILKVCLLVGLILASWMVFGWVFGTVALVGVLLIANDRRLERRNRRLERARRDYLAERVWLSGDRRPKPSRRGT